MGSGRVMHTFTLHRFDLTLTAFPFVTRAYHLNIDLDILCSTSFFQLFFVLAHALLILLRSCSTFCVLCRTEYMDISHPLHPLSDHF
jgi:hypothetical protein